ncbi:MAG: Npt1/Npt2 family nucleotide transporter [Bradymonadales bacterium]
MMNIFRIFTDIRKGELKQALQLAVAVFFVLTAYYIVKTLREPMILASAAEDTALLNSGVLPSFLQDFLSMKGTYKRVAAAGAQALALMAFVPFFSFLANRLRRSRLIVAVCFFFLACMIYFGIAMKLSIPFTGFAFYVWVGIFSLAMVALFWSYAADIYTEDEGKRLFPFIGIGASLGAILGSQIADLAFGAQLDDHLILAFGGFALIIYLVIILFNNRSIKPKLEALDKEKAGQYSKKGAFYLILANPYMRYMALMILMLNLVNTTGEYILSEYIVEHATAVNQAQNGVNVRDAIGSAYASFYFWVNIVSLSLQAFVVSRMAKYGGVRALLFALPLIAFGVYAFAYMGVAYMGMRWLKTAENASNYSIMNTVRAMLFLPASEEEKYKAKQAIDTFFVRIGDMLAAFGILYFGATLQFDVQNIALINLSFVALWIIVCVLLYKNYKALQQAKE